MSHQERHTETTKKQLLNCVVGLKMTIDNMESKLSDIPGTVDDAGYTFLIKKLKIIHEYGRLLFSFYINVIIFTHNLNSINEVTLYFK